MSVKHAILGLLAKGPLHGYELKGGFEELAPTTELNVGQVYMTLDRLSRDRLVTYEVVNQAERPDKKVYALTEEGRKELKEWLATPSAIPRCPVKVVGPSTSPRVVNVTWGSYRSSGPASPVWLK